MKWIGQHIYDLVARFRNDVYLEDLSTTTETNVLVVDSDGKVSKTTVITGDVTGVTAGSNITVTNPTGPVPTVALNTSLTGLDSVTSTSFVGALTGNADTATKISSITNSDIVQLTLPQTLTSKTLTTPRISSIVNIGTLTLPTSTDTLVGKATTDTLTNKTLTAPTITGAGAIAGVFTGNITGNVTGNADTATKIDSITNSDIVQLTATQALINKTFSVSARFKGSTSGATHLQATAVAGSTTLTLPAATDTLVGKDTADILTNKTLTSPTLTTPILGTPQSGDLTNCTFPTLNQSTTGNADTVTTNANLTGPVTSTGNATAIADGAITTAMQKHLQTFEFNGYSAAPASTNYFIPSAISENKGPFLHGIDVGVDGLTATTPSNLIRTGGKVMPYAGTCKLWKGWVGVTGSAAFNISIFKYTPVPNDATPDSLVLVKNFSGTALNNSSKLIAISEDDFAVGFDAGDILITGISCESLKTAYFTSTLEVEWD
jgi:hypothetical protein